MALNETIVTGRKFRKCIDAANKIWQRISFWTKASDVEFDDGKTAQEKLGAIDGITGSLTSQSATTALSAGAGSNLQAQITTVQNQASATLDQVSSLVGQVTTVQNQITSITGQMGTQATMVLDGDTLHITTH